MSAHTPGPWHVSGQVRAAVIIGDQVVRLGISNTAKADARLIAAAPDLLNALRALVDCYCEVTPNMTRAERDHHRNILIVARAAIAKATGEQP